MAARGSKLKKRSDANSRKPHKKLVFFIDRALGNTIIAQALRSAGAEVHVHTDHFAPDARDADWLPKVGKLKWLILTKDSKIRYHTAERQALINAGASAFILVSGNLTGQEMASIFLKSIPAIRRFITKHPSPFIAKVHKDSSVRLWYPANPPTAKSSTHQ